MDKHQAELPDGTGELIRRALAEDLGSGDLSGEFFVPENSRSRAHLVARATGCLAGVGVAAEVFRTVDAGLSLHGFARDGELIEAGKPVLEIQGSTRSLLAAERTALNFIQHLSGVATMTHRFVEAIRGCKARILDTRKTLPGWRALQKAAVRAAGGTNHRRGLFDMVMLKDNHLAALAGDIPGLARSLSALRSAHPGVRVEVEADEVSQVEALLALAGIDVLLLDNMNPDELRECVNLRDRLAPHVLLEASGGITLATAPALAATGVDFLSVGALTHSVAALDLALDFLP